MLPPIRAAPLNHQAAIDRPMHGSAALGMRKPTWEERQDADDEAVAVTGQRHDRVEHVFVGDPLPPHDSTLEPGKDLSVDLLGQTKAGFSASPLDGMAALIAGLPGNRPA